MQTWDDARYLAFAAERTRPARELLARVPLDVANHVFDLGCGPGNSTALLRSRFPDARVVGVDSSREMIARASADCPTGTWVLADAATYEPDAAPDLIFANALFQWLPDHSVLFPAVLGKLRQGGVLAVQMPLNFDAPSHLLMRELGEPWTSRLASIRSLHPVHPAAYYYDVLAPLARQVDIWTTAYEHVMPSVRHIVEWVKATGMRPYLDALSEAEQSGYLEVYERALESFYPARSDGKHLFTFTRLFFVVVR